MVSFRRECCVLFTLVFSSFFLSTNTSSFLLCALRIRIFHSNSHLNLVALLQMPYLSLSSCRNRATLIAALLIMEFLAILWLKESGPSQTQPHPHSHHPRQQQQQHRHSQDGKGQGQAPGKKIKGSKIKAAFPRFLNGGAGVAPYHIHDEQWDFSMRVARPERRRSEGSEDRKGSEKKLSSKTDLDHDHTGKKDSLGEPSSSLMKPPPPPLQAPRPIDIPAPPTSVKQNQQQQQEASVLGQPPIVQPQGHADQRAKTPEPAPSIGSAGIKNTSEQQTGEAKEKKVSLKEPVNNKGGSNIAPNITSLKDPHESIQPEKDEKTGKVSYNRVASTNTSTSNRKVQDDGKLSKKQRQQRQQQRQQRFEEKNQRGRFKSTKERKLAQLMPVLDEYGVVIEDHFISPRDSDGDGVPDYYVLLRPSSSIDTAAADIGLFEDEVTKAPLPPPLPKPPVPQMTPAPNMQGQPPPAPSVQVTIVVRNEPSQTSAPSITQSTNMPLAPPAPALLPSTPSSLS